MRTTRRKLVAVLAAGAIVTAACGSAPSRPIGVKEYPGDVVFGDQAAPPPPTVPPAADPAPGFPGFIAPPAPRFVDESEPSTTRPTTRPFTTAPAPACPEDDPLDPALDEAFGSVGGPPKAQTIPYRVKGFTTVNGVTVTMPFTENHRVAQASNVVPGAFRFDVGIRSGNSETVTTYQVDQRDTGNTADGVSIVQIRTSDQVATDAFTPSAPIRILPLPPVKGGRFTGSGADPLHGTALTIFGQVLGKARVNACGVPLEGWQVRVGTDPQTGQPSSIQGPNKNLVITGTYTVATQFGALIIADDLKMVGTDNGRQVTIQSAATTNRKP